MRMPARTRIRPSPPAPTSGGPKFRRRADARPDEILDAALAVFTEKGFEAARVDDIAARAGVSKGAVYLYFDSKDALLRGLIEREVAPSAARIRAVADAGAADPAATVRLLVATASALVANEKTFATPRIVLSVAPRFREIAIFYRERVIDEAIGAVARLIRAGVKRGVFRDVDADAAARMVMGPLLLYAMRRHVFGARDKSTAEGRAAAHLDILLHGLAAS
jgi:AcrR family transcriptional regulator